MSENPYISVIVPLFNEGGNVEELHKRIADAVYKLGKDFEIIFIDDGSSDETAKKCENLMPLKLIKFRKNFGQTAAFDAGIKNAKGEIIVTMDGDLQNDPADIKLLLDEMNKGYDVVSGWRWKRKDSRFPRPLNKCLSPGITGSTKQKTDAPSTMIWLKEPIKNKPLTRTLSP